MAAEKLVCSVCGFTVNSEKIMRLHKRDCKEEPDPKQKPDPQPAPQPETEVQDVSDINYNDYTRNELMDMLRSRGHIFGRRYIPKDELIKMLAEGGEKV